MSIFRPNCLYHESEAWIDRYFDARVTYPCIGGSHYMELVPSFSKIYPKRFWFKMQWVVEIWKSATEHSMPRFFVDRKLVSTKEEGEALLLLKLLEQ